MDTLLRIIDKCVPREQPRLWRSNNISKLQIKSIPQNLPLPTMYKPLNVWNIVIGYRYNSTNKCTFPQHLWNVLHRLANNMFRTRFHLPKPHSRGGARCKRIIMVLLPWWFNHTWKMTKEIEITLEIFVSLFLIEICLKIDYYYWRGAPSAPSVKIQKKAATTTK